MDSLAQEKEREMGTSEKKIEVPFHPKIILIIYAIFLLTISIFWGRIFQLQIIKGEELALRSSENRLRIYPLRPERGVIYDSNLEQLVWNKPSFDLVLDKRDFPEEEKEAKKILKKISEIVEEIVVEDLLKEIEKSRLPIVPLYENLEHSDLVALEVKIKNRNEFPGVKIEENTLRNYIEGVNLSHLIGYTGRINADEFRIFNNYSLTDYIGKTGLEKSYEEILRGKPGEFQIEKDARGRIIKEFVKSQPESGKSLLLWLDSELQKKIEQELNNKLKNIGAQKAAAIAINPQNGGILAMVSIPNFNNNLFSHGISHEQLKAMQDDELKPFLNRAVSGQYLTGSIIKPLIASAALQEKIIEPEKNILCTGEIVIENPWFNPEEPESDVNQKEWVYHDWRTHGLTDLRKAIAQSCNIYFYTIGGGYKDFKGLGEKKIKEYLELFGWGSKTGVDIPNEQSGFIPDPQWEKEVINDDWTIGDTYHLSIGQGYLKITPLQVASAFSAIANKGTLYEPRLVQKILDSSAISGQTWDIEPKIIREDFIEPEYLQIVREGMRQAITTPDMPSYILNSLPVSAAAKTGTAQTSEEDCYHHWVTIFAPYDEPEIVLTIIVEDVKGLGGVVLPVAKELLKWYFERSSEY